MIPNIDLIQAAKMALEFKGQPPHRGAAGRLIRHAVREYNKLGAFRRRLNTPMGQKWAAKYMVEWLEIEIARETIIL